MFNPGDIVEMDMSTPANWIYNNTWQHIPLTVIQSPFSNELYVLRADGQTAPLFIRPAYGMGTGGLIDYSSWFKFFTYVKREDVIAHV